MAKDEAELNGVKGVWRTIAGRKVFIRTGQKLSEAMKESGKFPSYKKNKEKKAGEKYDKANEEETELNKRENAKTREYMAQGMSLEDAVNKADKEFENERDEINNKRAKIVDDLKKKEDIKNVRGTIEEKNTQVDRWKQAKTKEEAYNIMREGYKEDIGKSRMTNREDMVAFIKEQTNIDISSYIEEKAGHPRTYLGVHLEKMPINQQNEIKNLMYQKGVTIGDNGGYGYALYYKKKQTSQWETDKDRILELEKKRTTAKRNITMAENNYKAKSGEERMFEWNNGRTLQENQIRFEKVKEDRSVAYSKVAEAKEQLEEIEKEIAKISKRYKIKDDNVPF